MHEFPELMALAIGALSVAALARRSGISEPPALVVTGLVLSFLPDLLDYRLDPEIVLVLVLSPLLYSAALNSSYIGIRASCARSHCWPWDWFYSPRWSAWWPGGYRGPPGVLITSVVDADRS